MTRYRLTIRNPSQWRRCTLCGVQFRIEEWDVTLCPPCYAKRIEKTQR